MARDGHIFGRGQQMGSMGMPNSHATDLNSMFSWRSVSKESDNVFGYFDKAVKISQSISRMNAGRREASALMSHGRFLTGLNGAIGTIRGALGNQFNAAIQKAINDIESKGGHQISGRDLSGVINNLKQSVDRLAGSSSGLEAKVLSGFSKRLDLASSKSEKGGFFTIGRGAQGSLRGEYELKRFASAEKAIDGLASKIKLESAAIADAGLKHAVEQVRSDMLRAAKSASSVAEKQKILADVGNRLQSLRRGVAGRNDRDIVTGLAQTANTNSGELSKHLAVQKLQFTQGTLANHLTNLSRSLGETASLLRPLKESIDLSNTVFQNLNGKFNQFARMQMRVSAERGAIGRQLRGSGIDYGHMMGALAAGRIAGMDDRTVVNQMVDLQTQLARARWGEGELINNAGKWGISVYDQNGDVKDANRMMIEYSRKLNQIGSRMEKLQFLSYIGRRPEEMEYVANYEKEARRQEYLRLHPEMRGALDRASYLDESGLSDKADAFTRREIRRRQVLNDEAIEQGVIPALKRAIHPENWLFSDWTARQQGVKEARGSQALEKLTRAIEQRVVQEKDKANKDEAFGALFGLSAGDLAALSEIAKADKADKGEKSGAALIEKAYQDQFGIKFDVRTPIEKLQGALEPLTQRIAGGVGKIVDYLSSSKLVQKAADNPLKTLAIAGVALLAFKGLGKFLGGFASRTGGMAAEKVFTKGAANAAKAAGAAAAGSAGVSGTAGAAGSAGVAGAAGTAGVAGSAGAASVAGTAGVAGAAGAARTGFWGRLLPNIVSGSEAAAAKEAAAVHAEVTAMHLNKSLALGGVGGRGSAAAEKAIASVIAENPALTRADAIAKIAQTPLPAAGKTLAQVGKVAGKVVGGVMGGLEVADVAWNSWFKDKDNPQNFDARQDIRDAIKASFVTGGAGVGSFTGPLGTLFGASYGSLGDALFGDWVTDKIYNKLVDDAEGEGSLAFAKKHGTTWRGDTVVKDPEQAGKNFLNGLRNALKNNETQRAMEILAKNGIHGLDVDALRRDSDFMKDDVKAQQTLMGAVNAQALASYVYQSGNNISMQDFYNAVAQDKYIGAAKSLGLKTNEADEVSAAMRQTGMGKNATPRYAIMQEYVKNAWKTDQEALRQEMTAIRHNNPEMSEGEIKSQAENRLKQKHLSNLTSEDMNNYLNSLRDYSSAEIEHAQLVKEAEYYGIDKTGKIRDSMGRLIDEEGYFVDDKGARIDKEGRHEGEEGYVQQKHAIGIGLRGKEVYHRLMNFRQAHADADQMSLDEKHLAESRKLLGSGKDAEQVVLNRLEKQGMDVGSRGFNQMFESEQLEALKQALYNPSEEDAKMDVGGRLSKFVHTNNISLDQGRNMLRKIGMHGDIAIAEGNKGSDARSEAKQKEAERKRKQKKRDNEALARQATDQDVWAAIKEDADVSWYDQIAEKKRAGYGLTEAEQEFYNKSNAKIARKVQSRQKRAASRRGDSGPSYSKDIQDKIDRTLRVGRESSREFGRNQKRVPLAQMSDMRQMEELESQGVSRSELTRRFGRDRIKQYEEYSKTSGVGSKGKGKGKNKRRATAGSWFGKLTRKEMEQSYRDQAEATIGKEAIARKREELQKSGAFFVDDDEAIKKMLVDERVEESMRTYDALHPSKGKRKGAKGTGKGDGLPGFPLDATDKLAQAGAQAEAAAASANAKGGDSKEEKTVTTNISGTTFTLNIDGQIPVDADGIKEAFNRASDDLLKQMASIVSSKTENVGHQ